jgi:hypothetical protein
MVTQEPHVVLLPVQGSASASVPSNPTQYNPVQYPLNRSSDRPAVRHTTPTLFSPRSSAQLRELFLFLSSFRPVPIPYFNLIPPARCLCFPLYKSTPFSLSPSYPSLKLTNPSRTFSTHSDRSLWMIPLHPSTNDPSAPCPLPTRTILLTSTSISRPSSHPFPSFLTYLYATF